MAIITSNPTANQTPDATLGGTAVTTPSNTGHASTGVTGVGGGSESKSCRWFGFPSVEGQIIDIKLKLSWSESGSIVPISVSSFALDYSLNGGSSWNNILTHVSVTAPNSGNESISIPPQDVALIQVRDLLSATDISGGQADLAASVSGIQLEVTTVDAQVIVMM